LDCLTVEYNGILADREGAREIARTAIGHMVQGVAGWDELRLSGIPAAGAIDYAALAAELGLSVRTLARSDCRYVDLARIRAEGGTHLDQVSSNTRYQVRRALRRYEARGKVALAVAQDSGEALARFDELKRLHQAAWTARGEPGSFANPFFEEFHRALIARTAGTGETQLVRVAAGETTVGILYNFSWRGRIHAYQSGFAFETDNAVKPGLVSHALAIEHAFSAGADIYDFMAGEAQHKASLATDSLALEWLAARRPVAKYRIEDALRTAKRRLRREPRA
jgi:CelD/BcsL family acetyltransferase involved in cellulose biosynthesis